MGEIARNIVKGKKAIVVVETVSEQNNLLSHDSSSIRSQRAVGGVVRVLGKSESFVSCL